VSTVLNRSLGTLRIVSSPGHWRVVLRDLLNRGEPLREPARRRCRWYQRAVSAGDWEIDIQLPQGGRRQLLEVPRMGMLNAHMARLPDLRGVDVLEWSILLGVQPGITVHWIDSGVATGDSLAYVPLSPAPEDTLASLRERAVLLSVTAIADQVQRGARGDAATPRQIDTVGPQFFALHPRLRARAKARLASSE
jgi:methionyl-tRNA formyltransferase